MLYTKFKSILDTDPGVQTESGSDTVFTFFHLYIHILIIGLILNGNSKKCARVKSNIYYSI